MVVFSSSPGKVILAGEHAVVYGSKAISIAINKRVFLKITDKDNREEGALLNYIKNYMKSKIEIDSELYTSSGLGSSAAICVSAVGLKHFVNGEKPDDVSIANESFYLEKNFQGGIGSPIDTSTSLHGKAIGINIPYGYGEFLWSVKSNEVEWKIYDIKIPEWYFVVINTGMEKDTKRMVNKVKESLTKDPAKRGCIDNIDSIVSDMLNALRKKDISAIGTLMMENEKELEKLGVYDDHTHRLLDLISPHVLGSKITGGGGGGSVIALVEDIKQAENLVKFVSLHNYSAFYFTPGNKGLTINQ
ncbi:MAG: mevalonate kinase family protein [Thermoplasmata archaeon]